jgi:hypothetical protein
MRLPFLILVAISALSCSAAPPKDEPPDSWSKPVNGLQARLAFAHKETVNGTPILITYLELRNVGDTAAVMEIPLDKDKIQCIVTDEIGKKVAPADGPFDEITCEIGTLRLPHDSSMRINIASRGAGIPKDQAAHLDLGPMTHWYFPRGEQKSYYLKAKFTIDEPQRKDAHWHGTLDIPRAKILIPSTPE